MNFAMRFCLAICHYPHKSIGDDFMAITKEYWGGSWGKIKRGQGLKTLALWLFFEFKKCG
jgi:hypothetical protein